MDWNGRNVSPLDASLSFLLSAPIPLFFRRMAAMRHSLLSVLMNDAGAGERDFLTRVIFLI